MILNSYDEGDKYALSFGVAYDEISWKNGWEYINVGHWQGIFSIMNTSSSAIFVSIENTTGFVKISIYLGLSINYKRSQENLIELL